MCKALPKLQQQVASKRWPNKNLKNLNIVPIFCYRSLLCLVMVRRAQVFNFLSVILFNIYVHIIIVPVYYDNLPPRSKIFAETTAYVVLIFCIDKIRIIFYHDLDTFSHVINYLYPDNRLAIYSQHWYHT